MNEVDKHRAVTIQIIGFALMTLFGNLVVNLYEYDWFKYGIITFFIYLVISLLLFYFGTICVLRSIEILMECEKDETL